MRVRLALSATVLTLLFLAAPLRAHEGHSDNDAPQAVVASAPRGEAHSADFEIVALLRDSALLIYLDRFATNEPIEGATIEIDTPAGLQTAEAAGAGLYRLAAPWAKGAAQYDLIFTVTHGDKVDILPLSIPVAPLAPPAAEQAGGSRISLWMALAVSLFAAIVAFGAGVVAARRYPRALLAKSLVLAGLFLATFAGPAQSDEGHDHGDEKEVQVTRDIAQRLPDGSIFVPKPVQRILSVRTTITAAGEHAKTIELPGRVIPDANASGYVQSNLAGRLMPPLTGFPALGSRVEKGQVLAYVEPPIQAIDASDMKQKEGEILQQMAIVERRVARFEKLVESNAVPRAQLEDARTELQSLRERKAALDRIRREPEELVAPVSGVIAEANTIAGQLTQPNTVVFQIIDPSRLWVEALSFDAIPAVTQASARNDAGIAITLAFRGSGAVLRNQSIPMHFAVENKAEGVWAGQFVTVLVALPARRSGIALPRAAVVRASNGQHVVFEHISAERFRAREVRVEPLDAKHVLITAGLEDRTRVAVSGAELIEQVR